MPVTVRTLETLIRLATAHAKMRLSKLVDVDDIEIGAKLLNNTIFQENDSLIKEEDYEEDEEEIHVDKINTNSRSRRVRDRDIK